MDGLYSGVPSFGVKFYDISALMLARVCVSTACMICCEFPSASLFFGPCFLPLYININDTKLERFKFFFWRAMDFRYGTDLCYSIPEAPTTTNGMSIHHARTSLR